MNMCEKTGKPMPALPLKGNAYPFGVHVRFGIKQSLRSLHVNAFKHEQLLRTEKMHFTKVIREC